MNKLCIHILCSLYMLLRDLFRKFFDKRKYKLSKLGKKVTIRNVYFCGENAVFSNTSLSNCYIGMCSYVSRNCKLTNVKIGNFCSIADNVNTCNGQHPTTGFVTTFPSFYYNTSSQIGYSFHQGSPLYDTSRRPEGEKKYEIVVGSDVWIGSHALLMPGIRIGDGAVIAAGSVVTKDVLPFSIVGGVPAKVIKMRFTDAQIDKLLKIKWWNKPLKDIKQNYRSFSNIDSFISKYD